MQDRQDVELRHQVQEHLLAGQIPEAMAAIEQAAPGTLDSHPRIKFRLQCQQFVEMVCCLPQAPNESQQDTGTTYKDNMDHLQRTNEQEGIAAH